VELVEDCGDAGDARPDEVRNGASHNYNEAATKAATAAHADGGGDAGGERPGEVGNGAALVADEASAEAATAAQADDGGDAGSKRPDEVGNGASHVYVNIDIYISHMFIYTVILCVQKAVLLQFNFGASFRSHP
jgi:hypothetical protein